ncbi:hypothetical protein CFOL_v3_00376 [Cephalotus follicularis]|uniref:Uncharacterized protein n=1 Tax=Cephalotus follicularis TaxID=3775 RepID=A0A1Q3AMB7_CEPFO|nr:hypothetical protein CFOL_v3_00376 [Cephalotus follicularis]
MENKKPVGSYSSSASLDHLFGPRDSSSSSSSSASGTFSSIFPRPSTVLGKDSHHSGILGSLQKHDSPNHVGAGIYGSQENYSRSGKGESSGIDRKDKGSSNNYQNETVEPCYLSSSIYYGGQENYSPTTRSTESPHINQHKTDDGKEDDPNGSNSNSASRGNWWQGSLYY